MSGIEISEDMTSSQLEALAGGELLKAEVSDVMPYAVSIIIMCSTAHEQLECMCKSHMCPMWVLEHKPAGVHVHACTCKLLVSGTVL